MIQKEEGQIAWDAGIPIKQNATEQIESWW